MTGAPVTSFGVHGSQAQVELFPGLDADLIDVARRGWGTVVTSLLNVPGSRPVDPSARFVWIHLAIPTPNLEIPMPLSLGDVVLKVATVLPVTDPGLPDAMHVWDGKQRIKAWDPPPGAGLGQFLVHGAFPVNSALKTGLGLSLLWSIPMGDPETPPAQFTVFGARATFERLTESTRP